MEPSPTRLRQIALVAKDLDKARYLITKVIGTEVLYEDPLVEHWGLKNFLVPIGGDIIEVVSPFKADTTAGRLLEKRGDGGYMIIMQTLDALTRKKHIEASKLGKVVFEHATLDGESICIQYHPKGVAGGVIPELDSHSTTASNPDPLGMPFSPWHGCGPNSTYEQYSTLMRRNSDLQLLGVSLRLKQGANVYDAARQWEHTFGVQQASNDGRTSRSRAIQFTNAKISFVPPETPDDLEGIIEIIIGVSGVARIKEIAWRASFEGMQVHENLDSITVHMLGVRWKFIRLGTPSGASIVKSRL